MLARAVLTGCDMRRVCLATSCIVMSLFLIFVISYNLTTSYHIKCGENAIYEVEVSYGLGSKKIEGQIFCGEELKYKIPVDVVTITNRVAFTLWVLFIISVFVSTMSDWMVTCFITWLLYSFTIIANMLVIMLITQQGIYLTNKTEFPPVSFTIEVSYETKVVLALRVLLGFISSCFCSLRWV